MSRFLPTIPCTTALLTGLYLILATPAPGQADDGPDDPAADDWASLGFQVDTEPTSEVDIGDAELARAALAAQATDPALAELLASVDAFSMRQYAAPTDAVVAAAEALLAHLVEDGWVLSQRDAQDARQVHIFVRTDGDDIAAIVVVAVEAGQEVTLAEIAGDLDPARLNTLGLPVPH